METRRVKVPIGEIKKLFAESLRIRGLTQKEIKIVSEPFFEAELSGKTTHGITRFLLLDIPIKKRGGSPVIIKDKYNYAHIDAQKELGQISSEYALDILLAKTKEYDNACVAVTNSDYYAMAGTYARKIALNGYIGIVINNGGPACVTPYGGIDPIFGTNPIAIGIPRKHDPPLILDMATSKRTWGQTNLAKLEGKSLENDIFLDKEGNFTTDPYKVKSILPFGGFKGAGLNFMLEILTGAFVGAKMGLSSENGYDLGFFFQAYSPYMFTNEDIFDKKVEVLINEIKSCRKANRTDEIFLPGEKSQKKYAEALRKGYIEVSKTSWNELGEFAKGNAVKTKIRLT